MKNFIVRESTNLYLKCFNINTSSGRLNSYLQMLNKCVLLS